jgi:hypothetical protein
MFFDVSRMHLLHPYDPVQLVKGNCGTGIENGYMKYVDADAMRLCKQKGRSGKQEVVFDDEEKKISDPLHHIHMFSCRIMCGASYKKGGEAEVVAVK